MLVLVLKHKIINQERKTKMEIIKKIIAIVAIIIVFIMAGVAGKEDVEYRELDHNLYSANEIQK